MAKFNLNFLQNILVRIFIPLNTVYMYMYSKSTTISKMRNLLIISVYKKLLTIP